MSHNICLLLGQDSRFSIAYLGGRVILDLEHEINLLEGEFLGLNVKVPDDGGPSEVQDGEDDVEPPADVGDGYTYRCQL
jgi:hypothetical protein